MPLLIVLFARGYFQSLRFRVMDVEIPSKRPRPSGGDVTFDDTMETALTLLKTFKESIKGVFEDLDAIGKKKDFREKLLEEKSSESSVVVELYRKHYEESCRAVEVQNCIKETLRGLVDHMDGVSLSPLGSLPKSLEHPPEAFDDGVSNYTMLHRVRAFLKTTIVVEDGHPVWTDIEIPASFRIDGSVLPLSTLEVNALYETLVGFSKRLAGLPESASTHVLKTVEMFVDKEKRVAIKKKYQQSGSPTGPNSNFVFVHAVSFLSNNLLPYTDECIKVSTDDWTDVTYATPVDASKICDSMFKLTHRKNNFISTRAEIKNKVIKLIVQHNGDVSKVKKLKPATLMVENPHILCSTPYHVNISALEEDRYFLYDVVRFCRSLGKDIIKKVPQVWMHDKSPSPFICLDFEPLSQVEQVALRHNVMMYCKSPVTQGQRNAVEEGLSVGGALFQANVQNDEYFKTFFPGGLQHGVGNLTNFMVYEIVSKHLDILTIKPVGKELVTMPEFPLVAMPPTLAAILK